MKKNSGVRWDTIVGIITVITMVCFAVIIFIDLSKGGKEVLRPKRQDNTLSLSLHDLDKMTVGTDAGTQKAPTADNSNTANATAANNPRYTVKGSPVVVLDPAHGGADLGTVYNGVQEKTQTLQVANAVKKCLEESGVKVVMTRNADVSVDNAARVSVCNSSKAVAVLSIERNSAGANPSATGAEAWIHTKKTEASVSLANAVLSELDSRAGMKNRGCKTGTGNNSSDNYYINAHCSGTSCVLQLGFMTNPEDDKYVTSQLNKTAQAISDGIVQYLKTKGY